MIMNLQPVSPSELEEVDGGCIPLAIAVIAVACAVLLSHD
jgi:lactobin A/cerein 7B family class IIb bacteriocin